MCAKKHELSKPRDWRKIHLGIEAEPLEIRAIAIADSRVGSYRGLLANRCATDAPMPPDLLN